jgi:hypothetical protein
VGFFPIGHRNKGTIDSMEARRRMRVGSVTHAQITYSNGSGVVFWRHRRS